ncbi:MAG: cation-transporting P-type ATPase [Armatimonadota bacterium]
MPEIRDIAGLVNEEAQRRLVAEGPNELPSAKPRGVFAIAVEIIRQPMFLRRK